MALALVTRRQLQPRVQFTVGRATLRFYHGDCLSVLPELEAQTVGIVVTPRRITRNQMPEATRTTCPGAVPELDRSMDPGGLPRPGTTGIALPERRRQAHGSLDSLEVAQVARRRLKLQNTIHWVKSIAIDREAAGGKRLS